MKSDDAKARYRRANIDEQRCRRQKRSTGSVGRQCRPSLSAAVVGPYVAGFTCHRNHCTAFDTVIFEQLIFSIQL